MYVYTSRQTYTSAWVRHMAALARKNVMVDPEQLRQLARRLGMNESEAVRYAVDRLLHEDEVMRAAAALRRRGGLVDGFDRTSRGQHGRTRM